MINVGGSLPYATLRLWTDGPRPHRDAGGKLHERALEVRAEFAAGKVARDVQHGRRWCTLRPGKLLPGARADPLRDVDGWIDDVRVSPIPPGSRRTPVRVRAAQRAANVIRSQVKAIAAAQPPLFLGLDEFGIERWPAAS